MSSRGEGGGGKFAGKYDPRRSNLRGDKISTQLTGQLNCCVTENAARNQPLQPKGFKLFSTFHTGRLYIYKASELIGKHANQLRLTVWTFQITGLYSRHSMLSLLIEYDNNYLI